MKINEKKNVCDPFFITEVLETLDEQPMKCLYLHKRTTTSPNEKP